MTNEEAMANLNQSVAALSEEKKALFQQWLDAVAAQEPDAEDGITSGLIQCLLLGTMCVSDIKSLEEGPLLRLTERGKSEAVRIVHDNPEARELWNSLSAASGTGSFISEPPKKKQ